MNDKKVVKKKRKRLKIGYVFACLIILVALIFVIKLILPSSSSKYGDRLDGIKKIKFDKEDREKIVKKIKSNDKVEDAKLEVQGKRIDIIYYVKKDTSVDEARGFANSSLEAVSDEVKKFYDIEFMVDKKDKDDNDKSFPDMGYKNAKSTGIVW